MTAHELDELTRRMRGLFDAFENSTTRVVGGLQEDVQGLRVDLDRLSRWAPGAAPENPAQLARFMAETHDAIQAQQRLSRRNWRALLALAVTQVAEFGGHIAGWW